MPGSGAEAERLKPGWPRRSPRVPPPGSSAWESRPFILSLLFRRPGLPRAAPSQHSRSRRRHNARQPALRPRPSGSTQHGGLLPPTHPPAFQGAWGPLYHPVSHRSTAPCWCRAAPLASGAMGCGGPPLGTSPDASCCGPRDVEMGKHRCKGVHTLWDKRCPWLVPIPAGKGTGASRPLCHGAAPHTSSLPTLAYPTSPCASPRMPGSRFSLLFVCYGFNWEERPRPH